MTNTTADPVSASAPRTGTEVLRFFSVKDCALISVRDNGTTWFLRPFADDWIHKATKKPEVDLASWLDQKRDVAASQPSWARNIKALPQPEEIQEWGNDCICETPTGHTVEPDGIGPDGAPSWLRALGLI